MYLGPDRLWPALLERTDEAIARGALHSIDTHQRIVEQDGVAFVVRIASNLERKAEDTKRRRDRHTGETFNPFMPPEPELTVGDISRTHIAVLNKFNVVERHLLIVTRDFEHQEMLLTAADFDALWRGMAGFEALGFYNGGVIAGASQRHRHLQMIPLPLTAGGPPLPIDPLIETAGPEPGIRVLSKLPFRHRFAALDKTLWRSPADAAARTRRLYMDMLAELGVEAIEREGALWQSAPYNLLVTRRWMLLVPRRREHYETISVNAMGFAGSLFVRDSDELDRVEKTGPMTILEAVA